MRKKKFNIMHIENENDKFNIMNVPNVEEMENFNIGDKIIITSNEDYIKGIYNHNTNIVNIDIFGIEIKYDRFFGNEIIGIIKMIGKYNNFLIESIDNKIFVFCNDYFEMKKR